jgi:hypothetical protein
VFTAAIDHARVPVRFASYDLDVALELLADGVLPSGITLRRSAGVGARVPASGVLRVLRVGPVDAHGRAVDLAGKERPRATHAAVLVRPLRVSIQPGGGGAVADALSRARGSVRLVEDVGIL